MTAPGAIGVAHGVPPSGLGGPISIVASRAATDPALGGRYPEPWRVLLAMASFAGRGGYDVRPSLGRIARLFGVHRRTIERRLEALERLGYIATVQRGERRKDGGKAPTTYRIVRDPMRTAEPTDAHTYAQEQEGDRARYAHPHERESAGSDHLPDHLDQTNGSKYRASQAPRHGAHTVADVDRDDVDFVIQLFEPHGALQEEWVAAALEAGATIDDFRSVRDQIAASRKPTRSSLIGRVETALDSYYAHRNNGMPLPDVNEIMARRRRESQARA